MLDVSQIERYNINGKWGLKYKFRDEKITEPIFDDIRQIKGTTIYFKIKQNKKWGVIQADGLQIVKPSYEDITFYDGKVFSVLVRNNATFVKDPNIIEEVRIIVDEGYWETQCLGGNSYIPNSLVEKGAPKIDADVAWNYNNT